MVVEITSKGELQAVAEKFKNVSGQLTAESANIIGNLLQAENFDGINISQAAMTIQNNLKNLSSEIEALSSGLSNYITDIKDLDTYDLRTEEDFYLGQANNVSSKHSYSVIDNNKYSESRSKDVLFLFEDDDSTTNINH